MHLISMLHRRHLSIVWRIRAIVRVLYVGLVLEYASLVVTGKRACETSSPHWLVFMQTQSRCIYDHLLRVQPGGATQVVVTPGIPKQRAMATNSIAREIQAAVASNFPITTLSSLLSPPEGERGGDEETFMRHPTLCRRFTSPASVQTLTRLQDAWRPTTRARVVFVSTWCALNDRWCSQHREHCPG